MKKVLKKKVFQYTAVFEADKKGGYTVSVPSLPGCISEGDDFESAAKNIREAASLYLEVMRKKKNDLIEEKGVIIAPIWVTV